VNLARIEGLVEVFSEALKLDGGVVVAQASAHASNLCLDIQKDVLDKEYNQLLDILFVHIIILLADGYLFKDLEENSSLHQETFQLSQKDAECFALSDEAVVGSLNQLEFLFQGQRLRAFQRELD